MLPLRLDTEVCSNDNAIDALLMQTQMWLVYVSAKA